jgi:hypothetical protein
MNDSVNIDPLVVGRSHASFAAAAQKAVEEWERQRGAPPEKPTTLRVVDMYVTVHNPIGDYIVVLGTGG